MGLARGDREASEPPPFAAGVLPLPPPQIPRFRDAVWLGYGYAFRNR